MKRVIYSIDERLFEFVKNKIEKSFEMNNDGYFSNYEGGNLKIFRFSVIKEDEKIRVFFNKKQEDNSYKLESTYEFSREYSEKLREIIFSYEDEKFTGWKEQHKEVESYIEFIESQV
jgi:hypothetical protein